MPPHETRKVAGRIYAPGYVQERKIGMCRYREKRKQTNKKYSHWLWLVLTVSMTSLGRDQLTYWRSIIHAIWDNWMMGSSYSPWATFKKANPAPPISLGFLRQIHTSSASHFCKGSNGCRGPCSPQSSHSRPHYAWQSFPPCGNQSGLVWISFVFSFFPYATVFIGLRSTSGKEVCDLRQGLGKWHFKWCYTLVLARTEDTHRNSHWCPRFFVHLHLQWRVGNIWKDIFWLSFMLKTILKIIIFPWQKNNFSSHILVEM